MPVAIASPTILSIPLGKILPNPHQPRKYISPESIQAMKASLLAIGQETPIKVRTLTEGEKTQNPGFEYLLLGGHRRLEGAKAAGLATLQAQVVDQPPGRDKLSALTDNQREEMHWLDWDLAVQDLYGDGTEVTQQELADQLEVSQQKISFALKVAGVLTPASREMIYYRVVKSGDDSQITEKPIRALAALGDPLLVERALPVVLDRNLTEAQAKKLVEWVKGGNQPEDFNPAKAKAAEPRGSQGLKGETLGSTKDEPYPVNSEPPVVKEVGGAAARAVLGTAGHNRTQSHRALSNSFKSFGLNLAIKSWKGLNGFYQKRGFKNPWVPTVVTLFLLLVFVNGLPGKIEHWVDHVFTAIRMGFTPVAPAPRPPVEERDLVAPIPAKEGIGAQPQPSTVEPRALKPQTGFEARGTQSTQGTESSGLNPKPHPVTPVNPVVKEVGGKGRVRGTRTESTKPQGEASNPQMVAWTGADQPFVSEFAGHFYGLSYLAIQDNLDYFKQSETEGFYAGFVQQYFPEDRLRKFQEQKLSQTFKITGMPRLLKVDETSDEFLVQGVVTTQSNVGRMPQFVSQVPVALKVRVQHAPGSKGLVISVMEVDPSANITQGQLEGFAGTQGVSPVKASTAGSVLRGAVNDLSDAVNTAQKAQSAVDAAKKLSGF